MTSALPLSYPGGWRRRWGHFAPQLLSVSVLGAILLGIRQRPASLMSLLFAAGLVVFVVATWVMMRAHDRRLCETCAASIPLNPMQEAARFRRRFQVAHQGTNPYFMAPYLLVLIGSNFLPEGIGRYAWAAIQASMIYLVLSGNTHRKLQPWCPWCSDDGGGTEFGTQPEPTDPRGNGRLLV